MKIIYKILIITILTCIFLTQITYAETMDYSIQETYQESPDIIIGRVLNIMQIVLPLIAIIFITIGIIMKIKIKYKINAVKKEDADNVKLISELKEKKHHIDNLFVLFGLIAFFSFAFSGILDVIKSFKPIIYLYPEEEMSISIELGRPELLTCTYPKYNDSWEVYAKPNGDLVDLKSGRNLYALYWESARIGFNKKFEDGFCVKGSESASFLEEKLEQLGLNEREAEEFIIYWLPELESSKYNLIRFKEYEEIERDMPLKVSPKPDTIIRILMDYKPLDRYVEIKEQKIITPERNGFVLVEWGGSKVE